MAVRSTPRAHSFMRLFRFLWEILDATKKPLRTSSQRVNQNNKTIISHSCIIAVITEKKHTFFLKILLDYSSLSQKWQKLWDAIGCVWLDKGVCLIRDLPIICTWMSLNIHCIYCSLDALKSPSTAAPPGSNSSFQAYNAFGIRSQNVFCSSY